MTNPPNFKQVEFNCSDCMYMTSDISREFGFFKCLKYNHFADHRHTCDDNTLKRVHIIQAKMYSKIDPTKEFLIYGDNCNLSYGMTRSQGSIESEMTIKEETEFHIYEASSDYWMSKLKQYSNGAIL